MASDLRTPLKRLSASDANARHSTSVAIAASDNVIDVAVCDVFRCGLSTARMPYPLCENVQQAACRPLAPARARADLPRPRGA